MSEPLDSHRTWFDLRRLNQVLHDFLMRFAPLPASEPPPADIAWEDGEAAEQTDAAAR
jgi:hypothetical protein